LELAWQSHEESLRYRREVGDPRGFLVWLEAMALWMAQAGQGEAAALALGAIEVTRTAGSMPIPHHESGDHGATDRPGRGWRGEAAALALGAIEVTRTAGSMPILHHEIGDHVETERLARGSLGDERFERALARGRWLTVDEMIERVSETVPAVLAGLTESPGP